MTTALRPLRNAADHDWRTRALCGEDPDYWYPSTNSNRPMDVAQVENAKRICRACPVLEQCRAAAEADEGGIGREWRHGIRAAMTPKERHSEWRRTHRKPAAA